MCSVCERELTSSANWLCFVPLSGWDQSDKFVKIYITDVPEVNQLKSENIKTNFTERYFWTFPEHSLMLV